MASTSETGHAVNVANFEDLISFCKGYGSKFNPSNNKISTAALETLHTAALAQIEAVNQAFSVFKDTTNQREVAFKELNKLSTRIINALSATEATPQTIDDARSLINKLTGKRATPKKPPVQTAGTTDTIPSDKSISTSQTGFDNRLNTFNQLLKLTTTESTYAPNESDLQIDNLNNYLKSLKTANTNVVNAYTNISNARISRNKVLYEEKIGLYDTSVQVKSYIKSVFGAGSPEYKQVSGLKFTSNK